MPVHSKNRLHDYEAGWLPLLVSMGITTKKEAEAAMWRVAQQAIDEVNQRRDTRQAAHRKRRRQ